MTDPNEKDVVSFVAKIISDGRVTIPTPIRGMMELREGDVVTCTVRRLPIRIKNVVKGEEMSIATMSAILLACGKGANREKLSKATNLSLSRLSEYTRYLIDRGLLKVESKKRGLDAYRLTDTGSKLVEMMVGSVEESVVFG